MLLKIKLNTPHNNWRRNKVWVNGNQRNTFIKTKPISGFSSHDSYNLLSRAAYERKTTPIHNFTKWVWTEQTKWANSHEERVMVNGRNITDQTKPLNWWEHWEQKVCWEWQLLTWLFLQLKPEKWIFLRVIKQKPHIPDSS